MADSTSSAFAPPPTGMLAPAYQSPAGNDYSTRPANSSWGNGALPMPPSSGAQGVISVYSSVDYLSSPYAFRDETPSYGASDSLYNPSGYLPLATLPLASAAVPSAASAPARSAPDLSAFDQRFSGEDIAPLFPYDGSDSGLARGNDSPIFNVGPQAAAADVPVETSRPAVSVAADAAAVAAPAASAESWQPLSEQLRQRDTNGDFDVAITTGESHYRTADRLEAGGDKNGAIVERASGDAAFRAVERGLAGARNDIKKAVDFNNAFPQEKVDELGYATLMGASANLLPAGTRRALSEQFDELGESFNQTLAEVSRGRGTSEWTEQQEQQRQQIVSAHNLEVKALNRTISEELDRERSSMLFTYTLRDPNSKNFRWDVVAEFSKYLITPAMTLWAYDETRRRDKRQFDQTLALNDLQWKRQLELAQMQISSNERIAGMELASAEASSGGASVSMSPATGRAPMSAPTAVR